MRFLADMGVSQAVVIWLRENRHVAWHLRERGLQRLPDREIFRLAGEEGRIVLTFDLDFSEIAALSRQTTSVILFRLTNERSANVVRRLESALGQESGALESGAILTIEEHRVRIRRLPLGSS